MYFGWSESRALATTMHNFQESAAEAVARAQREYYRAQAAKAFKAAREYATEQDRRYRDLIGRWGWV